MALSPQGLIKGLVARLLPTANFDSQNSDVAIRLDRYGAIQIPPSVKAALADEGTYFLANTAQTAAALTGATQTAFVATTPSIVLYNSSPTVTAYMDFIRLTQATAPTGSTNYQVAIVTDNGNRFSTFAAAANLFLQQGVASSRGFSPNTGLGNQSAMIVNAGQITATAATAGSHNILGNAFLKGAILAAADQTTFAFSAVDNTNTTAAAGNVTTINVPPVSLAPNTSLLVYVWSAGMTASGTALVEAGWYER
jgi:hypothetical protein